MIRPCLVTFPRREKDEIYLNLRYLISQLLKCGESIRSERKSCSGSAGLGLVSMIRPIYVWGREKARMKRVLKAYGTRGTFDGHALDSGAHFAAGLRPFRYDICQIVTMS